MLYRASLVAQLVKNPPAMQKTLIHFLGWEDPLAERLGYPLQYSWPSLVVQMIKNTPAMWETWFNLWVVKIPWRRAWQTHSSILAWRVPTDRRAWWVKSQT